MSKEHETEQRLAELKEKLNALITLFLNHNKQSMESFKTIDSNFESMDEKIRRLEESLKILTKDSSKEFKTMGSKLIEIKDELHKIQKVSNYSEEYENLLRIVGKA